MISLVQSAIHAYITLIAAVFIANLPTGAVGADTALQTEFATFGTLITVFAIRRAVDPLIAVFTPVTGNYR